MNKLRAYLRISADELMNKVSWPTWEELQSSTLIVMGASLIIAVIIYMIDLAGGQILKLFYQLFE